VVLKRDVALTSRSGGKRTGKFGWQGVHSCHWSAPNDAAASAPLVAIRSPVGDRPLWRVPDVSINLLWLNSGDDAPANPARFS
jgi:hypothetical protein